jgi:Tat protein secretion system quality control protein TatD with DNase activity
MKVPLVERSIAQQNAQQVVLLPFDAHNHVQLSPTPWSLERKTTVQRSLCGMAVMSTHPRDFAKVLDMAMSPSRNDESSSASSSSSSSFCVVPCLGVHPWFVHELLEDDWTLTTSRTAKKNGTLSTTPITTTREVPRWVANLEDMILQNSHVMVGEIGLDKFHFDLVTRQLTTPLPKQIEAFRYQLELAMVYHRPVSIHCVRAIGPLMETLHHVIRQRKDTYRNEWQLPKLYFHAFGGKAATANQIITTLDKLSPTTSTTTNTSSSLSSTVGLDRLVLETDLEDLQQVPSSMARGIAKISEALDVTEQELIAATSANARDLYNLR